jgi:hypothetical protein
MGIHRESAVMERLAAALADRYRVERALGAGGMATADSPPPICGCEVNLTPPHRFRRVGHVCQRTTPSGLPQRHARTRLGHGYQRTALSSLPQHRNPTRWGHFHVPPARSCHGDYVRNHPHSHKETFPPVANRPVPTSATARHGATAAGGVNPLNSRDIYANLRDMEANTPAALPRTFPPAPGSLR